MRPWSIGLRKSILVVLFTIIGQLAWGQSQALSQAFPLDLARAYRLSLKLKTDSAKQLATNARSAPEEEAQRILVLSMAYTVEALTLEDMKDDGSLDDRFDDWIGTLDDLYDDHPGPWTGHALAEVNLHFGLVRARFEKPVRALTSIRSALKQSEKVTSKYPDFLPGIKASGLYQTIVGLSPPKYHWMMKLMGLEGTLELGIAQLTRAANSAHAQQAEAQLLLGLTMIYVKDKPEEGEAMLRLFINNEADDLLGHTLLASALLHDQHNNEALTELQKMRRDPGHLAFYYPTLLEGELWLQRLNYAKAIPLLDKYLTVCTPDRFMKDVHYKLFMANYLAGNDTVANRHFYNIATEGQVGTEADRYALYFSRRGVIPDKRLLQARLLFDGGFDSLALVKLDSIRPEEMKTQVDRTERIYRRARIWQRQGRAADARLTFMLVVSTAGDDPSYFAPMACLQLGRMAMKDGRLDESQEWLEKVETYPDHEYKEGLDIRARSSQADLKRVRKGKPIGKDRYK